MSKAFPCVMGTTFTLQRGRIASNGIAAFGMASWPTDPIGSTSATFDGAIAGSEIRIYLPDGTELAGIESCAADQVLSWPVYSAGSPNNLVRIVIVNLGYRLKDFSYTSRVGSVGIPIQMETDKWFSNPA